MKKVEIPETHMTESRLDGPWNRVLFEIKALRDFFVEETILPRAVSQDQTFFTENFYVLKYIPSVLA